MPALQLENVSPGVIPVGTLIVVESTKARAYDEKTDSLDDVIGVVYNTDPNRSGRPFFQGDSPDDYNKGSQLYSQDFVAQFDSDGYPVPNPDEDLFYNPWNNTTDYTTILTHGLGPVLSTVTSVPARWKLLQSNTTYNWYFIR